MGLYPLVWGLLLLLSQQVSSQTDLGGVACGGNITIINQTELVQSPGWPSNYPEESSCSWRIKSRPAFVLRLNFTRVETEFCCDFVKISENGEDVKTLRGDETNYLFVSNSNEILLHFSSDFSANHLGFQAIVSSQQRNRTNETSATTQPSITMVSTEAGESDRRGVPATTSTTQIQRNASPNVIASRTFTFIHIFFVLFFFFT